MAVTITITPNSSYFSHDLELLRFDPITFRRAYYANLTEEEIENNKLIEDQNFYDMLMGE